MSNGALDYANSRFNDQKKTYWIPWKKKKTILQLYLTFYFNERYVEFVRCANIECLFCSEMKNGLSIQNTSNSRWVSDYIHNELKTRKCLEPQSQDKSKNIEILNIDFFD